MMLSGWWGKLLGGALGLSMGGPLGALLMGYLGHKFIDKNTRFSEDAEAIEFTQAAFFTATFSVMGHIAKADGHVNKDEIEMARQVMDHMNLDAEQRRAAIALFNQGKSPDFDMYGVMHQFKQIAQRKRTLMQMFIEIQLHAVYADGQKDPAEHKILSELANLLGFSALQLQQLEILIQSNLYNSASRSNPPPAPDQLAQAYQLLGVKPADKLKDITRAYRRLMSQHHPDKLAAKGLPEEMMRLATEKTQNIKKAYELIKKNHSGE